MSGGVSLQGREIPYASRPTDRFRELPPTDEVPILKEYGRLGLDRFMDKYAIPTETDDRGFVNYGWLLSYIDSLVHKDYVWTGRLDVHHLQWEAKSYDMSRFVHIQADEDGEPLDAGIPSRFRENPFHKLLIPRQMHDLIHVVTLPPEVPAYEEMKRRVRAFDIAMDLFQTAKHAVEIEEQDNRLVPIPRPGYESLCLDRKKRRTIRREVLLDRYIEFVEMFDTKLASVPLHEINDLIRHDVTQAQHPHTSLVSDWQKRIRMMSGRHALRPKVRWTSTTQEQSAA